MKKENSTVISVKNVFVLCAGRCGSMTFIRACQHITNYSAEHESRVSKLGDERVDYPLHHIEADNRLSWFLGRLDTKYRDDAVYVYLRRSSDKIAESYNKRWTHPRTIVRAYASSVLMSDDFSLNSCSDYVRTVSENIAHFLRDKTHVFHIDIDSPKEAFSDFWGYIGAEGDLEAALEQFDSKYNPSMLEVVEDFSKSSENSDAISSIERVVALGYQERRHVFSMLSEQRKLVVQLERAVSECSVGREKCEGLLSESNAVVVELEEKSLRLQSELDEKSLRLRSEREAFLVELDACSQQNVKLSESTAQLEKYASSLFDDYQNLSRQHLDIIKQLQSLIKEHNLAAAEVVKVKASSSFRMGHAVVRNIKSPLGWFKIPFSLVKALKPGSVAPITPISPVDLSIKKIEPFKKVFSSKRQEAGRVIFESSRMAETSFQDAESFVYLNGNDHDKVTFNILRANRSLSLRDEANWLEFFNAYLRKYHVADLNLRSGSESVFSRLDCKPGYFIDDAMMVSVIMPAFNAQSHLIHAASSILNQTWRNIQLIIVDDCSQDRTWELIQDLQQSDSRVLGLQNSVNVGPYVSKNRALGYVKGEYFTGQDSDDWSHPQRIEHQLAYLRGHVDCKASVSHMLRVKPNGEVPHFFPIGRLSYDGAAKLAPISCLFETEYFVKNIGAWDSVRYGADTELIGRLKATLGKGLIHHQAVSMICQDIEGSLTNDPGTGVRVVGHGLSPTRRAYRDSYLAWHKKLEASSTSSPNLQSSGGRRPFPAPPEMLVSEADIRAICQN